MEKKRSPILTPQRQAVMRTDIPAGPNEIIPNPVRMPVLRTQIPAGPDTWVPNPVRAAKLAMDWPRNTGADDLKENRLQYFFAGEWVPDQDDLLIGEENYRTLQNYRYRDLGLEGVQGYSRINTTALSTYPKVRSAMQLRTPHTVKSYVLVHAENSGLSASVMLKNTADIPSQGDFSATPVWTDDVSAGASLGRFSRFPAGDMGYCNGVESIIWGGSEQRLSAFIQASGCGASLENAKDKTDEMQNTLQDSNETADVGASLTHFVVGFTRPLQGGKIYVKTPAAGGNLTVKYWTGTAWAAVGGLSDGTGGLAHTGRVKFNSTVGAAKVKWLEERLLYWYDFELTAGSATLYHMTVDAPAQKITDIWDGVYRPPVGVFLHKWFAAGGGGGNAWFDYTMEMITETPAGWYPVHTLNEDGAPSQCYYFAGYYMEFNSLDTSPDSAANEYDCRVAFEEAACAMKFSMFWPNRNSGASTVEIAYWNGSSWQNVSGLVDRTKLSGRPFAQNGVVSWTPPSDEVELEFQGLKAYWYRIRVTNSLYTLDGNGCPHHIWVDLIQGVPSPRNFTAPYRFPFMFQNRALLCGYTGAKEGNRVDYSMMHAPNVWNGEDTSDAAAGPLYFGGSEDLTCACSIYNRFGSSVYNTAVFLKQNETYLLNGYDAETFKIYPVSQTIGCPAPKTLATAEVGYGVTEELVRNIAIWLSGDGPVIFDAGVLIPIKHRIACYFDRTDARCVNYDAIARSVGWVDATHQEYNLLIPSGSGQQTNNVWLVLDLVRKRWFEKVPSAASSAYLQAACPVTDEEGALYTYGFRDNGRMMRLENGTTFDGAAITQKVKTADQVPNKDMWDMTEMRRFKLICERVDESVALSVNHYGDGCTAASPLQDVSASSGSCRYVRDTQACCFQNWSHQIEVAASTSSEETGVPLLGWGYTYKVLRQDDG